MYIVDSLAVDDRTSQRRCHVNHVVYALRGLCTQWWPYHIIWKQISSRSIIRQLIDSLDSEWNMKIRVVFAPDDNYVNKYPSGGRTVMQFSEKLSQIARQPVKHCGITATSTRARQDGMILSCLMAHCECGNWMLLEQYCSTVPRCITTTMQRRW